MKFLCLFPALLACFSLLLAGDWSQVKGAAGNFRTLNSGPTDWRVALVQSIAWKISLPESGQSTPGISNEKDFFSTVEPVEYLEWPLQRFRSCREILSSRQSVVRRWEGVRPLHQGAHLHRQPELKIE